ncbi:MAG TPA: FAD-binding oxidoreductase [Pyrinomonadaceae bacterium]|jgi:sarcosine oxidase subunit beta|nr:FAD-binding oxidoreductase [Pyrinomonadaceae bacterium]
MTETADVVIIGGGIVGASVAYHLTEAGCRDVLILEREAAQGMGSSGKGAGGVRAQFSTAINIEMSLYSIPFFARFEEMTGHSAGYRADGYLFVATSEAHLSYLKANRERQLALGLKGVELLTADDISALIPQLRMDDVMGGSFCPTDGFIEPLSALRGFTARARERGARVWLDTLVTGMETAGGEVKALLTTRGRIATRTIVNATGAWAAEVARMAGVALPVSPLRRQLVITEPFDSLPSPLPMIIDMSNGFHFRREPPGASPSGVLMAWPAPEEKTGFKTDFDPDFIGQILERARARVPCLASATVDRARCRAGLYEVTPDHHAIIGAAPGVKGLFLANGFSGHGVMHAPATGRMVSELILDGHSRVIDASPLRAERFAEGCSLEETAVL